MANDRDTRCPDCLHRPPLGEDAQLWLRDHRARYCTAGSDDGGKVVHFANGGTLAVRSDRPKRASSPKPRSVLADPYPEHPYIATHRARFASGFERDLIPYGRRCQECQEAGCESTDTFLDGGTAHCANHLIGYCKHGNSGCFDCLNIEQGAVVTALTCPRPPRPLEEERLLRIILGL